MPPSPLRVRTPRLRGTLVPVVGALLAVVLSTGAVAATGGLSAARSRTAIPLAEGTSVPVPAGSAPAPVPAAAPVRPSTLAAPTRPVRPAPVAPRRTAAVAAPAAAHYLSAAWGIDVSFPQCGPLGMPRTQAGFAVVGLNNGTPFTANPCAAQELAFARGTTGLAVYVNTAAPSAGDPAAYGRRIAEDTLARVAGLGLRTPTVWLDVETMNHWADPATNVAVLSSAMRTFAAHGQGYGVYSSPLMWERITGGVDPQAPVWIATAVRDYHQVQDSCADGIGGRRAVMGQYVAWDGRQEVDVNMLCTAALPGSVTLFAPGLRRR